MRVSPKARHLTVGLGVVLLWSACFVVIEASRGDAPPLLCAGHRAIVGGLPLLALTLLTPPLSIALAVAVYREPVTSEGLSGRAASRSRERG